jgi:hypothetical protein
MKQRPRSWKFHLIYPRTNKRKEHPVSNSHSRSATTSRTTPPCSLCCTCSPTQHVQAQNAAATPPAQPAQAIGSVHHFPSRQAMQYALIELGVECWTNSTKYDVVTRVGERSFAGEMHSSASKSSVGKAEVHVGGPGRTSVKPLPGNSHADHPSTSRGAHRTLTIAASSFRIHCAARVVQHCPWLKPSTPRLQCNRRTA